MALWEQISLHQYWGDTLGADFCTPMPENGTLEADFCILALGLAFLEQISVNQHLGMARWGHMSIHKYSISMNRVLHTSTWTDTLGTEFCTPILKLTLQEQISVH